MLFFSERLKLAEKYQQWQEQNNVKDCALSVITFLLIKNLLNEEEVEKLLKEK